MNSFDIFNGDADGLCGITQLRLANPKRSTCVTGVKRNNILLNDVRLSANSQLTVVDISLHSNLRGLTQALDQGCSVEWFDHHHPGVIPKHRNLVTHIDTDPHVCSSLIINKLLKNRFAHWAIVAAFGDNLKESAYSLATTFGTPQVKIDVLKDLGVCINYNSYGACIEDLHYHPETLYNIMQEFDEPMNLVAETDILPTLKAHYEADLTSARNIPVKAINDYVAIAILPNTKWARRINGLYANTLSNHFPDRAHAILIEKSDGYTASIRAPQNNPLNAHQVALKFETGGGRHTAAGIQHLPADQISYLEGELTRHYCPH